jgi:isopentenyl-diphosphate delta-isomerase
MKPIILVDPEDCQIGTLDKMKVHQYGMLHRAFSVLLFRKKKGRLQTLLQQRSEKKYHAGGLWTNTCCSHPYEGEDLTLSAQKRLKEEMGIEAHLKAVGRFHYIAQLDNDMTENEIDYVLVGRFDSEAVQVNPEEAQDYQWMDIDLLQKELDHKPQKYTPWFKQALDLALHKGKFDELFA